MATRDFLLPDLGEGLTEGEIVAWLVAVGDTVEVDQPVAEVETAKAVVEVPSPFAGTVAVLHGAVGDEVEVGKPLLTIDVGGAGDSGARPSVGGAAVVPQTGPGAPPQEAAIAEMVPDARPD
ncbi:MAG: 2-oxo acid dehydrogenase subunit E2, partial [Actinomycetota bacterium]|nr:2-oxo acid dehydrogenase subunit E2 [Actinomycetota bacterium]